MPKYIEPRGKVEIRLHDRKGVVRRVVFEYKDYKSAEIAHDEAQAVVESLRAYRAITGEERNV